MNQKPKVFVTQFSPRLDFTQLADYGEVVFLTKKEFVPTPSPAEYNAEVVNEIASGMQDYIPGVDYIVTTGSAIPNMIVGAYLNGRTVSGVRPANKILKWSNRDHKYELYLV